MKAGDPKQATVLAVVAIVIVGVAVFRILPKKGSSIAAIAKAQGEARAAVASVAQLSSTQLRADPFFHPALKQTKAPGDPLKPSDRSDRSDSGPGSLPGVLPQGVPPDWNPEVGVRLDPAKNSDGHEAEENTGPDQQVKSSHQVVVNAIMTVAKTLAYISVDGEEDRHSVGDDLHGLGTIVSITSRAVVLKTPKGKVTLIVGEPKEL